MKKYDLPTKPSHRAMADVETTISFFEFLAEKIKQIPKPILEEMKNALKKSSWTGKNFFNHMADTYKILLESSAEIKFEKLKKQKTIIVYGSKRKRDKLFTLAKTAGISMCDLKSPNFYLSQEKLQKELEKIFFGSRNHFSTENNKLGESNFNRRPRGINA